MASGGASEQQRPVLIGGLPDGWTVDEAHVYVDDLISGGEFINRPAFVRMMDAIT